MSVEQTAPGRVIVIALVYPPDNYAGATRPHRFCKYLQELGFTVDVIAGTEYRRGFTEGNVHRFRAQYDYLPKSPFEKLLRRAFLVPDEGVGWIFPIVAFARRWRRNRPVVFSTYPPLTTHLAAFLMKKLYGWKWIADFRDPLVGNAARSRQSRTIDVYLEKLIFRNADAIVANTDVVAEQWRKAHPEAAGKIHCIWNGFDPEESLGAATISARGEQRVLRHLGVIYGDRYPDILLDSVERLIASGRCRAESLRVELIGDLDRPLDTLPSAPWFHCQPEHVPKVEAQRLMRESDYLLLLDVTRSNPGLQVPSKIFDYIRIGRPVLACTTRGSPVDRILERSGLAYVALYPGDSQTEIDAKVCRFLAFPSTPAQPSIWFEETFDGRKQTRMLADIIRNLTDKTSPRLKAEHIVP